MIGILEKKLEDIETKHFNWLYFIPKIRLNLSWLLASIDISHNTHTTAHACMSEHTLAQISHWSPVDVLLDLDHFGLWIIVMDSIYNRWQLKLSGTGKSQFLKFAAKLSNRSVITTGLGSTSAGLTVTAVKDGGKFSYLQLNP